MNFFLDTNVMLGYIFETDNWNSKSIQVVNYNARKYSCDYAQKECYDTYNSKLQKILREFRRFQKMLILAKSITNVETDIHNENFETENILLEFLNTHKHSTLAEIREEFSEFKVEPEIRCHDNYNYILNEIYFHTSKTPHKELSDKLQAYGFLDINKGDADDFEIIIDAHDLGLMIKNLFFITGDYTHIVSKKSLILSLTSIEDIIGLGEFNYT